MLVLPTHQHEMNVGLLQRTISPHNRYRRSREPATTSVSLEIESSGATAVLGQHSGQGEIIHFAAFACGAYTQSTTR